MLVTAGALVLLFLGWQLWWNDAISAAQQSSAASALSNRWHQAVPPSGAGDAPEPHVEPLVADGAPGYGEPFAVMYVPRFGEDSQRTIAEGTGLDVLNSVESGVGHYQGTQMPGAVGNFAIAAHRSAYGGGCTRSISSGSATASTSRRATAGTPTGSATSSTSHPTRSRCSLRFRTGPERRRSIASSP
ncbi:hypothetical protein GCM10025870_18210 [Agromyces marinus]|uniref:Class E sortase n=1 Tax=Agromyces marinus TaxID=1389020 RepID=A0ABN6YC11_9MICO|nr:hypothetical protein GCM10025870_18210 [Agromyces marinus]